MTSGIEHYLPHFWNPPSPCVGRRQQGGNLREAPRGSSPNECQNECQKRRWPQTQILAACTALIAFLLCPPAHASKDSRFANNPPAAADYQYALAYWGRKPDCRVRKEVSDPVWLNGFIGTARKAGRVCELEIAWGLGACKRRLTILHEFAHLLGMGHSANPSDLMYADLAVSLPHLRPKFCGSGS